MVDELIATDQWGTPSELYGVLRDEFHFQSDLCASYDNFKEFTWTDNIQSAVDMLYLCPHDIVLSYPFWMNPPYSRGNINHCMEQATRLARHERTPVIVTLTRFDPTASWFKEYIDGIADEVRMLARRVKFEGATDSYNFPCCVSLYNTDSQPIWFAGQTYYHIWDWK